MVWGKCGKGKSTSIQTLFTLVQMRGQASGMVDLACSKYQPSGDLNSDVNILTWLDLHIFIVSSVRSSYSHSDLLLITTPLFQITPVLNTGLSLSEPLQLYKGYDAI